MDASRSASRASRSASRSAYDASRSTSRKASRSSKSASRASSRSAASVSRSATAPESSPASSAAPTTQPSSPAASSALPSTAAPSSAPSSATQPSATPSSASHIPTASSSELSSSATLPSSSTSSPTESVSSTSASLMVSSSSTTPSSLSTSSSSLISTRPSSSLTSSASSASPSSSSGLPSSTLSSGSSGMPVPTSTGHHHRHLSGGQIAGIVLGSVFGALFLLLLLGLLALLLRRRLRGRDSIKAAEAGAAPEQGALLGDQTADMTAGDVSATTAPTASSQPLIPRGGYDAVPTSDNALPGSSYTAEGPGTGTSLEAGLGAGVAAGLGLGAAAATRMGRSNSARRKPIKAKAGEAEAAAAAEEAARKNRRRSWLAPLFSRSPTRSHRRGASVVSPLLARHRSRASPDRPPSSPLGELYDTGRSAASYPALGVAGGAAVSDLTVQTAGDRPTSPPVDARAMYEPARLSAPPGTLPSLIRTSTPPAASGKASRIAEPTLGSSAGRAEGGEEGAHAPVNPIAGVVPMLALPGRAQPASPGGSERDRPYSSTPDVWYDARATPMSAGRGQTPTTMPGPSSVTPALQPALDPVPSVQARPRYGISDEALLAPASALGMLAPTSPSMPQAPAGAEARSSMFSTFAQHSTLLGPGAEGESPPSTDSTSGNRSRPISEETIEGHPARHQQPGGPTPASGSWDPPAPGTAASAAAGRTDASAPPRAVSGPERRLSRLVGPRPPPRSSSDHYVSSSSSPTEGRPRLPLRIVPGSGPASALEPSPSSPFGAGRRLTFGPPDEEGRFPPSASQGHRYPSTSGGSTAANPPVGTVSSTLSGPSHESSFDYEEPSPLYPSALPSPAGTRWGAGTTRQQGSSSNDHSVAVSARTGGSAESERSNIDLVPRR